MDKNILLVIACTVFTSLGQLFLKFGMDSFSFAHIFTNFMLLIGMIFYGLGALLLIYALKHGELSKTFPFISLSFVWVFILSAIILDEPVTGYKLIGIPLIIFGVSMIGKNG